MSPSMNVSSSKPISQSSRSIPYPTNRIKFFWYGKEYQCLRSLAAIDVFRYCQDMMMFNKDMDKDKLENYIQVHGFFKNPADDPNFPNNLVFEEIPFSWFVENSFVKETPVFEGVNRGDRFFIKRDSGDTEEFIAAQINGNEIKLISLDDGNRWSDNGFPKSNGSWDNFKNLIDREAKEAKEIYKTRHRKEQK